jgi:hypothetical protein
MENDGADPENLLFRVDYCHSGNLIVVNNLRALLCG